MISDFHEKLQSPCAYLQAEEKKEIHHVAKFLDKWWDNRRGFQPQLSTSYHSTMSGHSFPLKELLRKINSFSFNQVLWSILLLTTAALSSTAASAFGINIPQRRPVQTLSTCLQPSTDNVQPLRKQQPLWSWFRHPKTINERRSWYAWDDPEIKDTVPTKFIKRRKRSSNNLPDDFDDILPSNKQKSWKAQSKRRRQWEPKEKTNKLKVWWAIKLRKIGRKK